MDVWALTQEQFESMSAREKVVRSGYIKGMSLDEIAAAAGISRDVATYTACCLRHRGIPVPLAMKNRYTNEIFMHHVTGAKSSGGTVSCHSSDRAEAIKWVGYMGGVVRE